MEQTENENQERYSCDFKKNVAERGRCVFKKKDGNKFQAIGRIGRNIIEKAYVLLLTREA